MKKSLLTVIALSASIAALTAQTIPNPGFETWTTTGNYEDPTSWGTLNPTTAGYGIKTALKAPGADAHSGAAAIKLISAKFATQFIPGLAATGKINTSTNGVDGGFSYDKRAVSLKGWHKYTPAGKDTASVSVVLSKWDATAKKRITVGAGLFKQTNTVAAYTEFTATINYALADIPDTCVIVLLSSQQNTGVANSTLFIDDLAFELPTGVKAVTAAEEICVFPNPNDGNIFVSNYPVGAKLLLYDIKGSKCAEILLSPNANQFNTNNGIYFYRIQNKAGEIIKNGKIIMKD